MSNTAKSILKLMKLTSKWLLIFVILFALISAFIYLFTQAKNDKDWAIEHALLPLVEFSGETNNPAIHISNIRDFKWSMNNDFLLKTPNYKDMVFKLEDIVELKAVVSHFSSISQIAHVFMIFVLNDGRELGVSIEARREKNEAFSIHGGLLAKFEIITLLATPEDLLGVRKVSNEKVHIYPIKETKKKAQALFILIANELNDLRKSPRLYHLFFKNCTNQLVKHVSVLTKQKYPWYFQTLAPGLTGRTLYELGLIDLPGLSFDEIQAKTLISNN